MDKNMIELKSVPRDWRKIARQAIKEDWTICATGGKHLQWRGPAGQQFITGSTPTRNGNSGRNALMLMKRNGINIHPA